MYIATSIMFIRSCQVQAPTHHPHDSAITEWSRETGCCHSAASVRPRLSPKSAVEPQSTPVPTASPLVRKERPAESRGSRITLPEQSALFPSLVRGWILRSCPALAGLAVRYLGSVLARPSVGQIPTIRAMAGRMKPSVKWRARGVCPHGQEQPEGALLQPARHSPCCGVTIRSGRT